MPVSRRQDGHALVAVLILLLVLSAVAGAYLWRMNADQGQVGRAQQSAAALYLAEAGAEKALWQLAHGASLAVRGTEGSLEGYEEVQGSGRFVIEKVAQIAEGTVEITVRGDAGGVTRRLRVTARLAPKALSFGLYAGKTMALLRQARLYTVPSVEGGKASERLGDIAVARHLWVEDGVGLNHVDGRDVTTRDGTVRDYTLFGLTAAIGTVFREGEILPDLVGTGEPPLAYGSDFDTLDVLSALQFKYPHVMARALRYESVSMPPVDLDAFRALARESRGNRAVNKTVGERMRDRLLTEKQDSLYTQEQFERILWYLDGENRTRAKGKELGLVGTIFVEGIVTIRGALRIDEGALVVKGVVWVAERARLEVRHSAAITSLPGVIAFGDGGAIRLAQESMVIVDGMVLAGTGLEVYQATIDVSGAIVTGQGLLNDGGLMVVRYRPDVMRTVGIGRTAEVLVRPLSWQEVR